MRTFFRGKEGISPPRKGPNRPTQFGEVKKLTQKVGSPTKPVENPKLGFSQLI